MYLLTLVFLGFRDAGEPSNSLSGKTPAMVEKLLQALNQSEKTHLHNS